ncbi:MAG TPA: hypothetical protein VF679_05390, partial [Pedobacter sp.]
GTEGGGQEWKVSLNGTAEAFTTAGKLDNLFFNVQGVFTFNTDRKTLKRRAGHQYHSSWIGKSILIEGHNFIIQSVPDINTMVLATVAPVNPDYTSNVPTGATRGYSFRGNFPSGTTLTQDPDPAKRLEHPQMGLCLCLTHPDGTRWVTDFVGIRDEVQGNGVNTVVRKITFGYYEGTNYSVAQGLAATTPLGNSWGTVQNPVLAKAEIITPYHIGLDVEINDGNMVGDDIKIVNNSWDGTNCKVRFWHGIRLQAMGYTGGRRIFITGNTLIGSEQSDDWKNKQAQNGGKFTEGIYAVAADTCLIAHNTIQGCRNASISLENCFNTKIIHNNIPYQTHDASGVVIMMKSCKGCTVSFNTIKKDYREANRGASAQWLVEGNVQGGNATGYNLEPTSGTCAIAANGVDVVGWGGLVFRYWHKGENIKIGGTDYLIADVPAFNTLKLATPAPPGQGVAYTMNISGNLYQGNDPNVWELGEWSTSRVENMLSLNSVKDIVAPMLTHDNHNGVAVSYNSITKQIILTSGEEQLDIVGRYNFASTGHAVDGWTYSSSVEQAFANFEWSGTRWDNATGINKVGIAADKVPPDDVYRSFRFRWGNGTQTGVLPDLETGETYVVRIHAWQGVFPESPSAYNWTVSIDGSPAASFSTVAGKAQMREVRFTASAATAQVVVNWTSGYLFSGIELFKVSIGGDDTGTGYTDDEAKEAAGAILDHDDHEGLSAQYDNLAKKVILSLDQAGQINKISVYKWNLNSTGHLVDGWEDKGGAIFSNPGILGAGWYGATALDKTEVENAAADDVYRSMYHIFGLHNVDVTLNGLTNGVTYVVRIHSYNPVTLAKASALFHAKVNNGTVKPITVLQGKAITTEIQFTATGVTATLNLANPTENDAV